MELPPENRPVAGVNDIGKKYGFVFTSPPQAGAHDVNLDIARTFAHEVGHGLTLRHRNTDPVNIMAQSRFAQEPTDMSNRLRKEQWDQIQAAPPAGADY